MSWQTRYRWLVVLSWLAVGSHLARSAAEPQLRRATQVRSLSAEQAGRALPVRLEGVITFVDEPNYFSFVQDDTGGVYFEYQARQTLKAGDRVEIEGVTAPGEFTPIIRARRVTTLGAGPWPSARRVTYGEFKSGAADSTFVEIVGRVHAAYLQDGWMRLKIAQPEGILVAWIRDPSGLHGDGLVDTEVRARGVCAGAFGWQTKIVDFELFASDATLLERLSTPTPEHEIPVTPISRVGLDWKHQDHARLRCRGRVTLHWPGQALYIQDEQSGLELKPVHRVDLKPGDWIEALGFPVRSQSKCFLDDCQINRLASGPPVTPRPIPLKDVHRRHRNGEYVTVIGRIAGKMEEPYIRPGPIAEHLLTRPTLILERDRWYVRAELPDTIPKSRFAAMEQDSVVEISGVIVEHHATSADPTACHILVESADALRVVEPAPLWSGRRMSFTALVGGGLFILLLGGVATLNLVRRRRMEIDLRRQSDETLRFQGVLLELAKSSHGQVDGIDLNQTLETVARALSIDRASLWRRTPLGPNLACTQVYQRCQPREGAAAESRSDSEWECACHDTTFLSSLQNQRICAITNVDADLDQRASEFRDTYLAPNGVRSLLVAPLLMRGTFAGALCLEETRGTRTWTPVEQAFATAAADQFVIVLESAERERAQRALLESEQKFARAFQNTPDALVVTTLDTEEYLEVNEAFCRITGYPKHEILGKHASVLTWARSEDRQRAIQQLRESQPVRDMESALDSKNGERVDVLVSCDRILVSGRPCLIAVLRDVTARNRADRQLREAHADLELRVLVRTTELSEARDRAESADRTKSAFLAAMSHELRTPLNSILGFTGILHQGLVGPLNDEQKKQLGMILNSGRHLLSLINDVLDISKIEANQVELLIEPFSLRDSITRACQMVSPLALKKGLRLESTIEDSVGIVVSDRRRVEQILINIINNAVKFTQSGIVKVDCGIEGGCARWTVTDTGIGIREEDIPKLFRPFQQLDDGLARQHEGTGLGLAICHRLIKLLGGRISVVSEHGKGSAFTVVIPVERPAPSSP
ncbi:MAG: PAS domain S-box protein [Verrucomicrobiales bacterium]|nr:PAS domain S-box protein [Verrucomicrobiales bacterium]